MYFGQEDEIVQSTAFVFTAGLKLPGVGRCNPHRLFKMQVTFDYVYIGGNYHRLFNEKHTQNDYRNT